MVTKEKKNEVLQNLYRKEFGVIDGLGREEVESIKAIIDMGYDLKFGFMLTLNDDGTKVRKTAMTGYVHIR